MARQCPECGHLNDDSLGFCSECGEAVDPEVILALKLKDMNSRPKETPKQAPSRRDNDDYVAPTPKKKETSAAPLVILGVVVVAIVAAVLFFL